MSRGGRLDDKSRPMSMPTRAAPLAPAALTRALTLARTPTSILTSATLTLAPSHPLSLTSPHPQVAIASLDSNLLRFSVKGYLLSAGLCRLAAGDIGAAVSALERYEGMDASFSGTREGTFLRELVSLPRALHEPSSNLRGPSTNRPARARSPCSSDLDPTASRPCMRPDCPSACISRAHLPASAGERLRGPR